MKFVSFAFLPAVLVSFLVQIAAAAAEAPVSPGSEKVSDLATLRVDAERGNARAQYNLGIAFAAGLQTPVDSVEALAWFTLAAERGVTGKELDALLLNLTSEQIRDVGNRLEAIRASNPKLRVVPVTPTSVARTVANTPSPGVDAPTASNPSGGASGPSPSPPETTKQLQERFTAAVAVLERERAAHAATRTELAQLENRLNGLITSRATLERDAADHEAAALQRERTAHAATRAEMAKLEVRLNELAATNAALKHAPANRQAGPPIAPITTDADARVREIVALEKSLSASRDELSATKTALAIANSKIESAESHAQSLSQTDSQVATLRGQIRLLERDLQGATTALKRVATDKTTAERALAEAKQQLATTTAELTALRQRRVEPSRDVSSGAEQNVADLRFELNGVKSQLTSAENEIAVRDKELVKLRLAVAAAESRPPVPSSEIELARRAAEEARQQLAGVTAELTVARQQAVAAHQLESRIRQLETEKATLLSQTAESGITKADFERTAAARDDFERKLTVALQSYTVLTRERDELRVRASAARELESRVHELEAEQAAQRKAEGGSTVGKEEFARAAAAQAAAENKLSTALRSFTLLMKERDQLRAQIADLSRKVSAEQER